jgi:hypothetical protein
MGEVLFFEPQRFVRRHASIQERDAPSTAVIVIFPGVRYERLDDADSHPCAKVEARMPKRPKPRPSRS